MTDPNNRDDKAAGLSWPRISGVAFAMALHVAGFMMLMAPVSAPPPPDEEEAVVPVSFTDPPPPPPPPPPERVVVVTTVVNTPRPTVVPPPPEQPPVVYNDPNANSVAAPPPAPPTVQTAIPSDVAPTEDISGRALAQPKYPPQELRDGVGGLVRLRVTIDANGNVLNVVVDKSSRNRNLDRAAMEAARRWKFNPGLRNGQKVGGDVIVPVNFTPQ
jgi:periplasmic protein TonB